MRLANRLVGNREDAACLATFGGLVGELTSGRYMALTGTDVDAYLNRTPIAVNAPYYARPGQELRLGRPLGRGVRTYLAVSGGFDAPKVLGSGSTDTASGLGPPVLRAGQRVTVGVPSGKRPTVDLAPTATYRQASTNGPSIQRTASNNGRR
jgi:allophanate hydrolase subunit 2